MIGEAFDRITFLINRGRHQEAIKELKKAIVHEPNNPILYILFAESFSELDKPDQAESHAKKAVQLAPDLDDAHCTLARVYLKKGNEKLALIHAEEAVVINPEEAENHAVLAAVYLQMANWKLALAEADQGLAVEPDNMLCLNIRTMALTKLGKKEEVDDTIRAALRENPEDALTHANQGWALLHQGKSEEAIKHFKESLRLDPTLEWARAGIVEAIKGKNIIYAVMLRFYLWLAKFPPRIQILMIVGLFFAEKIIRGMVASIPAIAPAADWILIAYISFVFMAWMSISFFNLLLRIHPEGKLALSEKQKKGSSWFGIGLLACILLAVVMYTRFEIKSGMWGLIIPLFLMFPITVTIKAKAGRTKLLAITYLAINTVFLIFGLALGLTGLLNISLIMSVVSTWIGNFIPHDPEMV